MNFESKFNSGQSYLSFLDQYGTDDQRKRWAAVHEKVKLNSSQITLLASFAREMKVMVLAGAWCGDCVNQCPIFDHFAAANSKIQIHYYDRDAHADLGDQLQICGAHRVPAVMFLSEDFYVCGRYGDKTLSKYRELAEKQLGPSCPTGLGAVDLPSLERVCQDWLNEFERIQLMLRLSGRLRALHQD